MADAEDLTRKAKEQGLIKPEPTLSFDEKYPLHAKFDEVKDEAAVISRFLDDWYERGGVLMDDADSMVDSSDFEGVIGDFFEIDAVEFDREKQRMLESIRETGKL